MPVWKGFRYIISYIVLSKLKDISIVFITRTFVCCLMFTVLPFHLITNKFTKILFFFFQLIPSSQPLPVTASGYFFYFSLLGNDVTNETFHDLINPNFPAERASVKIRSNVDTLRAFFSCQPGIQVDLSTADIDVMKGRLQTF